MALESADSSDSYLGFDYGFGLYGRLDRNPVVRRFWRGQRIKMPAYREHLTQEQVESLWLWIRSLREATTGPGAE